MGTPDPAIVYAFWNVISAWVLAGLTLGLLLTALYSLYLASGAGLFQQQSEQERRRPAVAFTLVDEGIPGTPSAASTAPTFPYGDLPPDLNERWVYWWGRAAERDPLDRDKYFNRRYRLIVDNAGPGPALKVRVPFTLTIEAVDTDKSRRADKVVTGVLEVVNVPAGSQRSSRIAIDATYYPWFSIELGVAEVYGLDGLVASGTVDLGPGSVRVEANNDELWDFMRQNFWEPSRPKTVVVTAGVPRRDATAVVVPQVDVSIESANGTKVSPPGSLLVISLTQGTFVMLSYNWVPNQLSDLSLPLLPAGDYALIAQSGALSSPITKITIP